MLQKSRELSILVVDDDPDSADAIAMLLECWNHSAHVPYDSQRPGQLMPEIRP